MNIFRSALCLSLSIFMLPGCERGTETAGDGSPGATPSAAPILGAVPHFVFTNQAGDRFGSDNLRGQPYLAAFMFTRCPSICPKLLAKMKEVDEKAQKEGVDLRLISISVDPEHDTPEVLSAYAKKHGISSERWNFVTGDFQAIAKTAEQGFKVALAGKVDEKRPHLGITHASHLILVDGQGRIRGYIRSSDEDAAEQVLRTLSLLDGT